MHAHVSSSSLFSCRTDGSTSFYREVKLARRLDEVVSSRWHTLSYFRIGFSLAVVIKLRLVFGNEDYIFGADATTVYAYS